MKYAQKLQLKDSVIDKLQTNFIDANNKTHEQIKYYFEDCKGRSCQGLGLFHKRKTKRKVMILDYWLNDGVLVENDVGESGSCPPPYEKAAIKQLCNYTFLFFSFQISS